jgi:hypothetical protein
MVFFDLCQRNIVFLKESGKKNCVRTQFFVTLHLKSGDKVLLIRDNNMYNKRLSQGSDAK